MKINKERKKNIYRKLKRNKGITLIALVVTIIVLLILAGISIQMLVGEGGILTNAREAARKTNQADAKERIELEIADAILEDNELTVEGINKHLKIHIPELTHEGQNLTENPIEELPTIVELDGFVFQIDENGKVTAIEGIALNKSNLELQILTHNEETEYGNETLTVTLIGISGNISWSTEGKNIIEVTPLEGGTSATVVAKQEGTEKVTATCSGRTAECNVTVKNVEAVTGITLEPTSKIINEGDELTITAETTGGTEDLTWSWEKISGDTVLTITPSGEGKKACTIVAQGKGTAKVTAKATYAEEATCKITVKSPYIDNSYVNYNVAYKDVYTGTQYTSKTGWRLLTKIEEEKDKYNETEGTYTGDIEIISTGIPAKLYYYHGGVSSAKWAGTAEDGEKYLSEYSYSNRKEADNNIRAASGLLYHFKDIVFKYKGTSETDLDSKLTYNSYNYGGFVDIVTNGEQAIEGDTTTGGSLFTANIASGTIDVIRSVNLKDLTGNNKDITTFTDARKGLFTLFYYSLDYESSGYYFLASPNGTSTTRLRGVVYNGNMQDVDNFAFGLRPVVSISNVHMKLNGHVWEIIE